MNKDKYFEEQVNKILPKQKPLDTRNFFQRNRTLIIIIVSTLVILYIGVNIYVSVGFQKINRALLNVQGVR